MNIALYGTLVDQFPDDVWSTVPNVNYSTLSRCLCQIFSVDVVVRVIWAIRCLQDLMDFFVPSFQLNETTHSTYIHFSFVISRKSQQMCCSGMLCWLCNIICLIVDRIVSAYRG